MAIYTSDQVEQYLGHINFPRTKHPEDAFLLLTGLQRHHIARVPFDSVALHYSPHRLLSLDREDLFEKIVVRSRGGYCMEVNTLFATILRSLGFHVYSAGGRVRHESWNHMVNIVTIDETKYLVDVGYGRREPIQPVPLTPEGYEFAGIASSRCKLERKTLARHTPRASVSAADQSVWVYSVRITDDDAVLAPGSYSSSSPGVPDWEEQYSFTEVEFFPEDFEVMNFYIMTRPQSYFVQTVLAYRAILDEDTGELVGELILHKDSVKRILRGLFEVLEELRSEEERAAALGRYFFISLTEKERTGIRGLASELKAQ